MPELPEVETVVRGLKSAKLAGLRILSAQVQWPKTIAAPAPGRFVQEIRGLEIRNLARRGKFVVVALSRGYTLLIHLRMSGRLHVARPLAQTGRRTHDRVVFELDDGRSLRFEDTRKFGRIWLVRDPARVLGQLGPEPLTLAVADFYTRLAARSRLLKPMLLDQRFIAGIGNIYADEALWGARLHPQRQSDSLSATEVATLSQEIKKALRQGIRNLGTTFGAGQTHFVLPGGARGRNQEQLSAYGQTGQPCPRCGTRIQRMIVGQRATHICSKCQRLRPHARRQKRG